jgi:hypothetical protein
MPSPSAQYMPDTVEPSEKAWAREWELYRKKQDEPGSER